VERQVGLVRDTLWQTRQSAVRMVEEEQEEVVYIEMLQGSG
jgi:hypothetical protein